MSDSPRMALHIEPCDCEVCRTALGAFFQLLGQKIATGELVMKDGQISAFIIEGQVELDGTAVFVVPD